MVLDKEEQGLGEGDEEALGKVKLEQEEDGEVLDTELQELGEDALEFDGIMMMAGVRNHADDDSAHGGGQDHGEEGLGADDDVHHGEACENDECHGEACEDDDLHDEGLEELGDDDHDVEDGDHSVEDDDYDEEDDDLDVVDGDHGDLDGHKDQGVHMVQDDDDGEGLP